MTDRVNTLTVVLESPVREDDVERLMACIGGLRGVATVRLGEVEGAFGARAQERRALFNEVVAVFEARER